jgi:hypothetical protein
MKLRAFTRSGIWARQKKEMLFSAPVACPAAAMHAFNLPYACWLKKDSVNTSRLVR